MDQKTKDLFLTLSKVLTSIDELDTKLVQPCYDRLLADISGGDAQSVGARHVILTTHRIENAKILLYSGSANSSGQLGHNLMDLLQTTHSSHCRFYLLKLYG